MATSGTKPKARAARWPWLTHGVILACVGVFLATYLPSRATLEQSEAKVAQASFYYLAHPYLRADARVLSAPSPWIAEEARAAYLAERERSGAGPVPESEIRRQQTELDALLVEADALLAALPYRAWGVVPANFDPKTLGT